MSAFNWVLLSFPIYLFTKGKFPQYLKYASKSGAVSSGGSSSSNSGAAGGGSSSNGSSGVMDTIGSYLGGSRGTSIGGDNTTGNWTQFGVGAD